MAMMIPLVSAKAATQSQRKDVESCWSLCPGQPKARPGYGNELTARAEAAR
jgi:hypothetical protein